MTDFSGPTPTDKFLSQTLFDYSDGDNDFERELIESYISSVGENLPKLKEALETRDEKNSILHSHDIKGSSSYIGAEAVKFLSGKMEFLCKDGHLEDAEKVFDELEQEVNDIFELLNKHMKAWETEPTSEEEDKDKTIKQEKEEEKKQDKKEDSKKEVQSDKEPQQQQQTKQTDNKSKESLEKEKSKDNVTSTKTPVTYIENIPQKATEISSSKK